MTETLNGYCKRTEQEKRELSQRIAQMECSTFQHEKTIARLQDKLSRCYQEIQSKRDKVLDVLDIELDEIKSRIESSTMGQPLSERSRGEIIGLLHAREKIKYLRQSKAGEP